MNAWLESAQMSSRNLSVLLVEDSRVLAERLRETLLSVPGVPLAGTVASEAAEDIRHHSQDAAAMAETTVPEEARDEPQRARRAMRG